MSRFMKHWKEHVTGYLLLLPALAVFLVFVVLPIFYSMGLSLFSWDMLRPNPTFIGLDNYEKLLSDTSFYHSLGRTLLYALLTVPASILLGLSIALLLDHGSRSLSIAYRTFFFSPMVTSTVAISVVWILIYHPDYGAMNMILSGLGAAPLRWLNDPSTALLSLAIMAIWKGLGFNIIVLLAGLQSIPRELEEAARLDGATNWRIAWRIKAPLLTPVLFLLLIMKTIDQFQTFSQIDVMTSGGPAKSTQLIVYHLYHYAFQRFEMGYASAIAVMFLIITLAFTLLQMAVAGRKVHYQ